MNFAARTRCPSAWFRTLLGLVALLSTARAARAADLAEQMDFELKAGPADAALKQLGERFGQQVIYPTDLVQGVKTRAIKGRFTAREALAEMLAGSSLTAWQDEATGALAVRPAPKAKSQPAAGLATLVQETQVAPRAPEAPAPTGIDFDLGAGEARFTLKQFSAQAGRPVVYPPELAEGVTTRAVKGRLPAKAALEQMLADGPLSVWQDERTGLLALGRAASTPRDRTIELPPFVVEESLAMHWRYAAVPGMEILSRCDDAVTTQLIAQHHSLHEMLSLILPKRLQFRSDVSTAYLFFSERGRAAVSQELLADLEQHEAAVAADQLRAGVKVRPLPNYRFWDQDALSIFFLWEDNGNGQDRLRLAPSYVRYLLERRIPALPRWFIEGTLALYQRSVIRTAPLGGASVGSRTPYDTYSIQIRPAVWISPALTEEMAKRPRAPVKMLRLADLFTSRPAAVRQRLADSATTAPAEMAASPEVVRLPDYVVDESTSRPTGDTRDEGLRRSQAELFIRWMLSTGNERRRAALWDFVDRASVQPVSEAMFQRCFGLDYRAAERELQDYVHAACRNSLTLHPSVIPELGPIELREATEAEVSRIKGDFDRLEIRYVRQFYPAVAGRYVDQARRTLRKSFERGDRDPRLLAELGLCECDAGNDGDAEPYLDAAVKRGVLRPRAYYELARIRFASLRPREGAGKLKADQLDFVLAPLRQARRQAPVLLEAWELMAEAWLCAEPAPSREQLAELKAGLGYFPREMRLLYSIALITAANGYASEAGDLIRQGLEAATEPVARARFVKLQALLAENKGAR